MKIEFHQELNRKTMAVYSEAENDLMDSFQFKMLTENAIKGLLPCTPATVDGCRMLCYETEGWIALRDYLQHNYAREEFLRGFIRSLAKLMDELSDYLIPGESILAGKDVMFTDPEGKDFRFAVFPTQDAGFESGMQRLSELLITRLSHNDQHAAAAGYGLYQLCVSGRLTTSELKALLNKQKTEEAAWETQESVEQEQFVFDRTLLKDTEKYREKPDTKRKKKFSFSLNGSVIWKKIKAVFKKDRKKVYPPVPEEEDEEFFRSLFENREQFGEETGEEIPGTVFIGQEDGRTGKTGYALIPSDSSKEPILLEKEETLIGRMTGEADVIIRNTTVSRVHAKLIRRNGKITIRDCHSTNGTKVNGRLLSAASVITLADGDEVCFGTAKYHFQINCFEA